ncbi:MAG: hypothetical protein IMX01_03595 [Limnochordaceae bacterium]|nr:hypothetical protein [Limnochordaceae bacterium]
MQKENPFLYLGRLALSGLTVVLFVLLLIWLWSCLRRWGDQRERRVLGRRAFPSSELGSSGYAEVALREGQAGFASSKRLAAASVWSGASLALIVPVIHLLYATVILLIGLISTTGAPPDPGLPEQLYPWPVFLANLRAIAGYLPRVGIAAVALGLFGLVFGFARRRLTRQLFRVVVLGVNVPGSWLVGVPLSLFIYWLAGISPITPQLHWLLDYLVAWPLFGYLGTLYLHRTEDAALYWLTRFDWPARTQAAVHYVLLDQFSGVQATRLHSELESGKITLDVPIPRPEAGRLVGQLLAFPGVEQVDLFIGGELVRPPADLVRRRLWEMAAIRRQRHRVGSDHPPT